MARTTRRAGKDQTVRTSAPEPDEIARRAYDLFVARGGEHGHDLEDWLEAESALLTEHALHRPTRGD
jgi:hypothetical protein